MAILIDKSGSPIANPLDMVDEMLLGSGIAANQPVPYERTAMVAGNWAEYALWYRWEKPEQLLLFTCLIESAIAPSEYGRVYELLCYMNEKLKLRHFELRRSDGNILFRRNIMVESSMSVAAEKLEKLLDIAIIECDRCHPALQAMLWEKKSPREALECSLFETMGEA